MRSARLTPCTMHTIPWRWPRALAARSSSRAARAGISLPPDYAFGASLESDTAKVVKASGGQVLGSVKHPLSASDFSSFLLQAQASKAQILGLANAGGDTINAIKAANEFGITKTMKLAGLLMFINDVHSLGLNLTKGMYLTDSWYWDQNDETRKWSRRYFSKMKKMPSSLQAADYSATMHYLNAVKAAGTDDTEKALAKFKATKVNDMYAKKWHGPRRRQHDPRHVSDAGEGAGRLQVSVGLLQGRANHPGRSGVHDQGGNEVLALDVNTEARLSQTRRILFAMPLFTQSSCVNF